MSDEPRKRSRFDQVGDSEAPRRSKFDRRSRSPPKGDSEAATRSRSPVAKSVEGGAQKKDPAAAAAEAAARINAQLSQKKAPQHVDVPPIRPSAESPSVAPGSAKSPSAPTDSGTLNVEIYQQDGDYIKDIEVNDLRNRYTLTKGNTQKMIKEETGADVTTRGNYYPDKRMATPANPPLYLHVTSTSKEGLELAVKKIEEMMNVELPNLIDERRFRRPRESEQPQVERDHLGRRKWPEERIPIDLEPIPGFNLRAQVVGAGGSYVKHIQQETRCRVQIKGRGSGFKEHDTGIESDEQMYLHVTGPDPAEVENAKSMCLSLLDSVKESYAAFKERPQRGYGGGYGSEERGGYGGRGRDRDNGYGGGSHYGGGQSSYGDGHSGYGGGRSSYGGGQSNYGADQGGSSYGGGYGSQTPAGYGGAQSPPAAASATAAATGTAQTQNTMTPEQFSAWATYYAQNPSQDQYAQYGGWAAVMAAYGMGGGAQQQAPSQQQQYAEYYQSQMAQAGTPTQNGGGAAAPPPPPPDDNSAAPPPPPGGPPGAGSYSSVPPPPGM